MLDATMTRRMRREEKQKQLRRERFRASSFDLNDTVAVQQPLEGPRGDKERGTQGQTRNSKLTYDNFKFALEFIFVRSYQAVTCINVSVQNDKTTIIRISRHQESSLEDRE